MADSAGALERVADADREHTRDDGGARGVRRGREGSEHERERQLFELHPDQQPPTIDDVGKHATQWGQDQQWSELREEQQADVRSGVCELVAVGTEEHVLHPCADVGGERAAPHDSEVAM